MITAMSLTNETLTLVLDNGAQVLTARNDHPKWSAIIDAFKAQDETTLRSLLSLQTVIETYSVGMLSINNTGVTYNGRPVHTVDAERVMAFLRDGLPYKPIANYISRKMKNPSARAIQEMYNFLEHRGMPLTPQGTFIAYKGVQSNFYSITGNKDTVVLQGKVDEEGRILNEIGVTIEVERSGVDDDFRKGCSAGLHAGSLQYAAGWGKRVVLVEIDPADVVSVPSDCDCQKLRCCKYKVVGEYTGPMPDTYTDEFAVDEPDICHYCGDDDCDGTCEEVSCPDCGYSVEDCTCNTCPVCDEDQNDCKCKEQQCACGETCCPDCNPNHSENTDAFHQGVTDGIFDRGNEKSSRYLYGDQDAADSVPHSQYILGYLRGFWE